jgi:flagellum-specific peptidoglycan hydrolase FlgJ
MNEIIKNAVIELNGLDDKQVVKVAGVLQRIQNWLKSLTDPAYRERVNQLKNDSAQISSYLKNLDKYLEQINLAIENGDVDKYNQALEEIKHNASFLSKELDKLSDEAADVSVPKPTNKEEVVQKEEPTKGILKTNDILGIDNLVIGEGFKRNAHQRFVRFLSAGNDPYATSVEAEEAVQDPKFWNEFKEAVAAGKVIKSFVRETTDDKKNLAGDYIYYVQSVVFTIPKLPISLQVEVFIVDQKYNKTIPNDRRVFQRIGTITPVGEGPRAKARMKPEPKKATAQATTPWYLSLSGIRERKAQYNQGNFVKAVKTNITKDEFISSLKKAWPVVFPDIQISERGVDILWAHTAMETGNFQSMYNYNLGNIKATPKYSQNKKWTSFSGGEVIDGKTYKFTAAHPMNYSRSYDSLDEAMVDYLKILGGRFKSALMEAVNGNVESFSKQLKEQGYYTADEKKYTNAIKALLNEPNVPSQTLEPANDNDLAELERALGIKLVANNLTEMVVNAISDKVLPRNDIKIKIKADKFSSIIEYAYILSNAISRTIDADTDICVNGSDVEINCNTTGDVEYIKDAVQAIDNIVSKAFLNNYKSPVISIIKEGKSKYSIIKENKIERERRKFAMERI